NQLTPETPNDLGEQHRTGVDRNGLERPGQSASQVVESRLGAHQEVVVGDVPGVGAGHGERHHVAYRDSVHRDLAGEDVLGGAQLAHQGDLCSVHGGALFAAREDGEGLVVVLGDGGADVVGA